MQVGMICGGDSATNGSGKQVSTEEYTESVTAQTITDS